MFDQNENLSAQENQIPEGRGCVKSTSNSDVKNITPQIIQLSTTAQRTCLTLLSSTSNENPLNNLPHLSNEVSMDVSEPLRFSLSLETEDCLPSVDSISPQNCLTTNVSPENTPDKGLEKHDFSLSEAFSNMALATPLKRAPDTEVSNNQAVSPTRTPVTFFEGHSILQNNLSAQSLPSEEVSPSALDQNLHNEGASATKTASLPNSPFEMLLDKNLTIIGAVPSGISTRVGESPSKVESGSQKDDSFQILPQDKSSDAIDNNFNDSLSGVSQMVLSTPFKKASDSKVMKNQEFSPTCIPANFCKGDSFAENDLLVQSPSKDRQSVSNQNLQNVGMPATKTASLTTSPFKMLLDKSLTIIGAVASGINTSIGESPIKVESAGQKEDSLQILPQQNIVSENSSPAPMDNNFTEINSFGCDGITDVSKISPVIDNLPIEVNKDAILNNMNEDHYSEVETDPPVLMAPELPVNSLDSLNQVDKPVEFTHSIITKTVNNPYDIKADDDFTSKENRLNESNSSMLMEFSVLNEDLNVSKNFAPDISVTGLSSVLVSNDLLPASANSSEVSVSTPKLLTSLSLANTQIKDASAETIFKVSEDVNSTANLPALEGACQSGNTAERNKITETSDSNAKAEIDTELNLPLELKNNTELDFEVPLDNFALKLPVDVFEVSEDVNMPDGIFNAELTLSQEAKSKLDFEVPIDDLGFKVPLAPNFAEEEEQFADAVQFFKEPTSFQYLENIETSNKKADILRSSLFVNFDPLHSRVSSQPKQDNCALITQTLQGSHASLERNVFKETVRESTGNVLISFDSPIHMGGESRICPATPPVLYTEDELQQQLKTHELLMEEAHLKMQREVEEESLNKLQEMADNIQEREDTLAYLNKLIKSQRLIMEEMKLLLCALPNKDDVSKDKLKLLQTENLKLKEDVKTVNEDLLGVEQSFSDLHKRYEQMKVMVKTYKDNEEHLRQEALDCQNKVKEHEQMNHMLKERTNELLEKANAEVDSVKKAGDTQITVLKAQLKKAEMKISGLESDINKIKIENNQLEGICNDLMVKVGES